MSTQITMEDGTRQELTEHLHGEHQKGTRGFTEDYLRNLHVTLHQRNRSTELEHSHPMEGSSSES